LNKIIIIGLGNILLTDEGIGIHILNKLKKQNPFPNTQYLDLGTSSYELINFINEEVDKVLIIDCLRTANKKPGEIAILSVDDILADSGYKMSLHQMKLTDTLGLIAIDKDLPDISIIGIVPFDMDTYSTELSPTMRKQFKTIVKNIEYIHDFIQNNSS